MLARRPGKWDASIASTCILATFLKAGLPVEHLVLVSIWYEAGSIFDEQEGAALAWAEVVTRRGDWGVPDSAFEAAAAVFGEKQLADLTITIGLMNA